MRPDLTTLEREFAPLLETHAVELVALEWFQGPGHGILRVTVDLPNGDPRVQDPSRSIGIAELSSVTRDISAHLDTIDPITMAYTLEVGSPGPERPVQRRRDFDRFAGLEARVETTVLLQGAPHKSYTGVLRGTVDAPESDGGYRVRVEAQGKVHEVPAVALQRARTVAIKPAPKTKPGKGPSKRKERLEAREKARAINAEHIAKQGEGEDDAPARQHSAGETGAGDAGDAKPRRADDSRANERHGKKAMTETAATNETKATGAHSASDPPRGGGPKHDGLAQRTTRATTR